MEENPQRRDLQSQRFQVYLHINQLNNDMSFHSRQRDEVIARAALATSTFFLSGVAGIMDTIAFISGVSDPGVNRSVFVVEAGGLIFLINMLFYTGYSAYSLRREARIHDETIEELRDMRESWTDLLPPDPPR